jgi:DNA-binding NarL/FixJ family response regulator
MVGERKTINCGQKGPRHQNFGGSSLEGACSLRRVRVLLADDYPLTLEGIRAFLEPHCTSVGTVSDGRALLEEALRLKPDLIVLDITMPLLNGIDSAIEIKKCLPGVKLVFITMHPEPAYLEAALNAGAMGYVLKSAVHEELLDAMKSAMEGQIYVSQGLSSENPERFRVPGRAAVSPRLASPERETLQLIAEGKATKEIAYILEIPVRTVVFHRESIKHKLGFKSTAEMTRHAMEQGLV